MARRISELGGGGGLRKKSAAKSEKPKKLSKYGEWCLAHPNGLDLVYIDMRAVLK